MKPDFWGTVTFYLVFIIITVLAFLWGGYGTIALVWGIAGVVGALAIAYVFRPDSASRTRGE